MSRIANMRGDRGLRHRAENKVKDFLEPQVQGFIKNSPFVIVASSNSEGDCDASSKGGKPGFIKIIDDKTLMMPDIRGNNLSQSFENHEINSKIGLVFIIPGMDATARVNGRVMVLEKKELVSKFGEPELYWADDNAKLVQATVIFVDEAYFHCPRSFKFGNLWDPDTIKSNIGRSISSLKAPQSDS